MEADDAVIFCLRFVLNEVPRGNLTGWLTKDEKASDLKLCGDVCVCVCFQTHAWFVLGSESFCSLICFISLSKSSWWVAKFLRHDHAAAQTSGCCFIFHSVSHALNQQHSSRARRWQWQWRSVAAGSVFCSVHSTNNETWTMFTS